MVKEKLMDWMPDYYTGRNTKAIQEARDTELQKYEAAQKRTMGDMYPSTAEDISLWEKEYRITPTSSDLDTRRQKVLAYIRGGNGAATREKILEVAAAFMEGGYPEIEEFADDFLIKITSVFEDSFKLDIEELRAALYDMVQAHVEVELITCLKRTLIVKERVEKWSYPVPACGTINCGTYWLPSHKGYSVLSTMELAPKVDAYTFAPVPCGTIYCGE